MATSILSSRLFTLLSLVFLFFSKHGSGLASSDTITWGGGMDRAAYESGHNMDPAVVGSPQFGLLYKTLLPGTYDVPGQGPAQEQIYASPLVYTGSDGVQYVYVATTQNNVYKINGKTGAIVASRNLHRPFLQSDLDGCADIAPTIGITATGVIDPSTDTWYFTAKTYIDQDPNGATGRPNGRYYIHAISTVDLTERPNYPVNLEGTVASNSPIRVFQGGIHHQRPALLQYNNYIYAGFASHCIQYNYTGWIMGWNKDTGELVEQISTEGAGVSGDIKGAGVWMSGGGIASDGTGSMWFSTGNGYASQLDQTPVNGRNPPTALEEAVVHMNINDDGSLSIGDFFMPWEKVALDGADKDLGTTPFQLLPSQFSCGAAKRIGMVTGKSGKTYWLNMDDLGGFRNGPDRQDNAIQVYQHENSVYSGAGVYPLEGGYIYVNVIKYPTRVFQFSCQDGTAYFNPVATTTETNAFALGVGHGAVTSLNGQPGTGLYWVSDVEGSNLRVYSATPQNGNMTLVNSFVSPGTTKFMKLAFGDGIVYQGSWMGYLYAYGSPVNLPLNCTGLQFGSVNLNTTSDPQTVQCQANTDVTVTAAQLSGNPNFIVSGLPNFPLTVPSGQNFSFQAVFNPKTVGPLSSSVLVNTTSQDSTFSSNTPVQLKGTGQSQSPILQITPQTVTWNGVLTGQELLGVNQSAIFSNLGNSPLTITAVRYSTTSEQGPWISTNGTANATQVSAFTFYNVPSTIPPNTALTVPINFLPPSSGAYSVYVRVESTGGAYVFDAFASGSDQPKALVEFETMNGTWTKFDNSTPFTFGDVIEGQTRQLRLRITNMGGVNGAPLSLTVSKPPFALVNNIIGTVNNYDLREGTLIGTGQNATAMMYCSPPRSQVNIDSYNQTTPWTMNMNDPSFGHTVLQFYCNAVAEQVGPINSNNNQSALYQYAGCYKEYNPGRQLSYDQGASDNQTVEGCISACQAQGYIFAGLQFHQECWCGNIRPLNVTADANCNYACTGNVNEICGGNGIDQAGTYISLFGDRSRWNGDKTSFPGPWVNPGAYGYSSIGCYTEATQGRALDTSPASNNTVAGCLNACQGFKYAGVEYGGECYCGDSLADGSVSAPDADCNMNCNGNSTEYCGGPSRLNMYQFGLISPSNATNATNTTTSTTLTASTTSSTLTTSISATTTTTTAVTASATPTETAVSQPLLGWAFVDCHSDDDVTHRALSDKASTDGQMTTEKCALSCAGFSYMGTEYGDECYCGNQIDDNSATVTDGRCSMPCAGNNTQICGGSYGLSFYKWVGLNATTTTSTTTTLIITTTASTSAIATTTTLNTTTQAATTSSTANTTTPVITTTTLLSTTTTTPTLTTTTSTSTTTSLNTTVATTITPSSTTTSLTTTTTTAPTTTTTTTITTTTTTTTSKTTTTTTTTTTTPSPTTTSQTTTTTRSTTSTTTSTTTTTSGTAPTPNSWSYYGCASDNMNARTLNGPKTTSDNMTVETCTAFCQIANYAYAGVEYSKECYCGMTLANGGAIGQSSCNMPCGGNSAETCGGPARLSVYKNSAFVAPKPKSNIGKYKYQGCFSDNVQRRSIGGGYMFADSTNMTEELCVNTCQSKGYPIAGVEYGQQCFCGSNIMNLALLSTRRDESECNMLCPADNTEYCGAGVRLNVWVNLG